MVSVTEGYSDPAQCCLPVPSTASPAAPLCQLCSRADEGVDVCRATRSQRCAGGCPAVLTSPASHRCLTVTAEVVSG